MTLRTKWYHRCCCCNDSVSNWRSMLQISILKRKKKKKNKNKKKTNFEPKLPLLLENYVTSTIQFTVSHTNILFLTCTFQNFIHICWHCFLYDYISKRSWPCFSGPYICWSHIYIITIIKFSNKSIQNLFIADKETCMVSLIKLNSWVAGF